MFDINVDYDDVWIRDISNDAPGSTALTLHFYEKESLKPTGRLGIRFKDPIDLKELAYGILGYFGESPQSSTSTARKEK